MKPDFSLRRVYEGGGLTAPLVIPVVHAATPTRREMLAGALALPSIALGLTGCRQGLGHPKMVAAGERAHAEWVHSIAVSSDGRVVVSEASGHAKLWSLPDVKLIGELDRADSFALTPDGRHVVAASRLQNSTRPQLGLWLLPDGKFVTYLGGSETVQSLAISPDGRLLVAARGKHLEFWALPSATLLSTALVGGDTIDEIGVSPDGTLLAAAAGKVISLWSLSSRSFVRQLSLEPCPPGITCHATFDALVFSRDAATLLARSAQWWSADDGERRVRAWSTADGSALEPPTAPDKDLWDKPAERRQGADVGLWTLMPDGVTMVATGFGTSGTLDVWALPSLEHRATLGPSRAVSNADVHANCLCRSPDGKLVAVGLTDGNGGNCIDLWSVSEARFMGRIGPRVPGKHLWMDDTFTSAMALCFAPDSKHLLSGHFQGELLLWDATTLTLVGQLTDAKENPPEPGPLEPNRTPQPYRYTGPCTGVVPAGAVCTCNCV